MKKLYLVTTITLLAFGLLIPGCAKKDLTKGKNPQQITEAVISKSRQIKNYSFISYIHAMKESSVTGKISAVMPSAEAYDFYSGDNAQSTFSIYMRGSNVYVRSNQSQWQPLQGDIMEKGTLQIYLDQITSINPATVLPGIYKNRLSLKRIADDKIDNHSTAVLEIETDGAKIPTPGMGTINSAGKAKKMKVTIWVGKTDLLVYRYYVEGKLSDANHNFPMTVTTNMSDYNLTKVLPPEELKKVQQEI